MKNEEKVRWVLRFTYILIGAYTASKIHTKFDLMMFSALSAFMPIIYYLSAYSWTIGTNDGRKFLNNKKEKDEIINN